jgi:peptidoglycan hydrolase-like protein with peptidoglycan-binding domain
MSTIGSVSSQRQVQAQLPELALGDKGPLVSKLQEQLNKAGFPVKVDGDWGQETDAAVRKFQTQHGLKPDGIVGPKTRAALHAGLSIETETKSNRYNLTEQLSSPDSELSVAIGMAEGTRTADGGKTAKYEGKLGADQGTFSTPNARTPHEADRRGLEKLRAFLPQYEEACRKAGIDPGNKLVAATCFEMYNRAPATVIGKGGMLEQLPTLAKKGVTAETILEARVQSQLDPATGKMEGGKKISEVRAEQKQRLSELQSGIGGPPPKIGLHSQGPEVQKLKQVLKDAGFYKGVVNDIMGHDGIDALSRAKTAFGIGGPKDIAGPETLKALSAGAQSRPQLHVEIDFLTQLPHGDCSETSQLMMETTSKHEHRVTPRRGNQNVIECGASAPQGNTEALKYVRNQLEAGKPVMIGVNYKPGTGRSNTNDIDHYVVVTGMGVDQAGRQYLTFNDPQFPDAASGSDKNPKNRLYSDGGNFKQDRDLQHPNWTPYDLRGVVRNV